MMRALSGNLLCVRAGALPPPDNKLRPLQKSPVKF